MLELSAERRRQKIAAEMKTLEMDYAQYRKPEVMLGLKASVLDRLWAIFGTSVVTPDAAPFVVGRMIEAFEPYRAAVHTIQKYEVLESKLTDVVVEQDEISRGL